MGEYSTGTWLFLRKLFAISGLIQAFTWLILAILCIVIYFSEPGNNLPSIHNLMITQKTPFIDMISWGFYDTLLFRSSNEHDRVLVPTNFHVIVWIYATLSLCWFGLSMYECFAVFKSRSQKYTTHNLMVLSLVTLLICTLDIVLFTFSMNDYSDINAFDYYSAKDDDFTDIDDEFQAIIDMQFRYKISRKLCFAILCVLAVRGVVLWFFNCVAGFCYFVISFKVFQMPPILQYDDTIPRLKFPRKRLLSESSSVVVPFSPEYEDIGTRITPNWVYNPQSKPSYEANKGYQIPRNRHGSNIV